MKTKAKIAAFVFSLSLFSACSHSSPSKQEPSPPPSNADLLDLSHLRWLSTDIPADPAKYIPRAMSIVSVYAERDPATGVYHHVHAKGANNQGPELEGISALDDVARAAVLLLRLYESNGDSSLLPLAKRYLEFVLWMQAADGSFQNFIYADLTKNEKGLTSKKGMGWWAARGIWALGTGVRILQGEDPELTARMKAALERSFPHFEKQLKHYGRFRKISASDGKTYKIPLWFMSEGSDLTSVFVLGLAEYYRAHPEPKVKTFITQLCDAIASFQFGDFNTPPYQAHLSWAMDPRMWHGWGSHQMHALSLAGRLLNRQDWIDSARREADQWGSHMLIVGIPYQVSLPKGSRMLEQIAYAQSALILGFDELAQATGTESYRTHAGLFASWFHGNNILNHKMFEGGLAYDGISYDKTGKIAVNLNSGAEATIEALLALFVAGQSEASRKAMEFSRFHAPVITNAKGSSRALGMDEMIYPLEGEIISEERVYENPKTGEKIRLKRDSATKQLLIQQ